MAAGSPCTPRLGLEGPSGRIRLGEATQWLGRPRRTPWWDHCDTRNLLGPEVQRTRGYQQKQKREIPGNDLLSHPVARAVPSALVGLTAVFGMGTGVSPPL